MKLSPKHVHILLVYVYIYTMNRSLRHFSTCVYEFDPTHLHYPLLSLSSHWPLPLPSQIPFYFHVLCAQ